MDTRRLAGMAARWPVIGQIRRRDLTGLGDSALSARSRELRARTTDSEQVVQSICPYCGVGCGQIVHVTDGKVTSIEGDPDSPISGGTLCPKGAASFQLVTGEQRQRHVLYRRPHGAQWERIGLEQAMDMVAQRVKASRDDNWEHDDPQGRPLRRTLSMAHLGGATLDNEENYLIKKLFTALGVVQIDNQARI